MSYTSSVASKRFLEAPSIVASNWPFILLFSASEALFHSIAPPTVSEPADFWTGSVLRNTIFSSLAQGAQDVLNFNLWGFGFQPNSVGIIEGEDIPIPQAAVNAYY